MPIQLSITQPSGAVATYHVVSGTPRALFDGTNQVVTMVNSYLSQATHAAGDPPLSQNQIDVSPMLTIAAPNPPSGATVQQAIVGMMEQYLLTTPTFTGGTQVS